MFSYRSGSISRVECLRTIDRLRLRQQMKDGEVAEANREIFKILAFLETVDLSFPVLERAELPFPTLIGTLDAIHLSSALLWQQSEGKRLTFITHNTQLYQAAVSVGFEVLRL